MLLRLSLSCCHLWASTCERGAGEKTCCGSAASTLSWGYTKTPSRRSCNCHTSSTRSCLYLPIHQSVSQSVSQTMHQSVNQSTKQSVNQSVNQSTHQSVHQPANPSINECMLLYLGLTRGVNRHLGSVCTLSTWCTRQAALERQDLSCMYLAHHELESVKVTIVIITQHFKL